MTTFSLSDLDGRTYWGEPIGSTTERPTPEEQLTWCATCGTLGASAALPHDVPAAWLRTLYGPRSEASTPAARQEDRRTLRILLAHGYRCPSVRPIGCTVSAPLDGPGAMADRRRSIASAINGTGHNVKPDVTPGIMARGSFTARTTARRTDGGKVTRRRLTVHGHATLTARRNVDRAPWAQGAGTAPYSMRATAPAWLPARDFTTGVRLNANGTAPKVVTRRRRSRAAILAASGTAPAPTRRRPDGRRAAPVTADTL